MEERYHSVRLAPERCQGCVNCTKRCPTEAIRIRGGKAHITSSRCIDCGECIRHCPSHAKMAVTDDLIDLQKYKYNIALPAPSLYGQFNEDIPVKAILSGLLKLGFNEVFEVAHGAEIVSLAIKDYLKRLDILRPAISSACPAVVRLIQVKFPEIIDHIVPFDAPVEVAGRLARAEAERLYDFKPEEIGTWFITPCPAKMTAVYQPLGTEKSSISGAIAISKIYHELSKVVSVDDQDARRQASWVGVGWAAPGGETSAIGVDNTLVVHDIYNVTNVLEQVALGKLKSVDYIEVLACAGGCIGGPLTVENHYVAEHRMKKRIERKKTQDPKLGIRPRSDYSEFELGVAGRRAIEPKPALRLDADINKAMSKIEMMDVTLKSLPGLDCGSCGSPNCKALAEDIAQGRASMTDCLFLLRKKVRDLAYEMVNLADKLPPPLDKDQDK
ncbi:[Fe-Fe] hydrogenase large subunit C-terminal domain-containing protein [Sporomusa acidovorans]|uniref:Ion-translocating oxidoreductase complex subunit B n=1 Tax=Sporomusa acidovorans (strain ATCC 49682 / DSM 3132 / Mol) TaxID=1123286 RepID=A0ABZ3J1R7_SPOA4|nr:[Fe-Fe] hydrogenase large subunit C-terminal domain-containing protein [Sporomusa acidovorans]OZC22471.1 periplasmic [Fe] hydrogenase large subunit [Sporomusa acidovorans DSM 3132]SDE74086.1 Iron only hydrogenase large subunit, C-terminal domain [Sporomusa acidovorans]